MRQHRKFANAWQTLKPALAARNLSLQLDLTLQSQVRDLNGTHGQADMRRRRQRKNHACRFIPFGQWATR